MDASHWRVFQGHPFLWLSTRPWRCFSIKALAASLLIPSLPAKTQEAPQKPQTSRSFPSFVHPHLAAATGSILDGLFEYVESLKVSSRERNDCRDEGRYSAEPGNTEGESPLNLNVNAFLALVATRLRIAVKWGVFALSSGAVLLRKSAGVDWDFELLEIPYFCSVVYIDRERCVFLNAEGSPANVGRVLGP